MCKWLALDLLEISNLTNMTKDVRVPSVCHVVAQAPGPQRTYSTKRRLDKAFVCVHVHEQRDERRGR